MRVRKFVQLILVSVAMLWTAIAQAKDAAYFKIDTIDIAHAKVAVICSMTPGGNLPGANLVFPDGTMILLRPVCEGDYYWCIRPADSSSDTGWIEVGSLKIDFDKSRNLMNIEMKVTDKKNYQKFKKYLDVVIGNYKKASIAASQVIAKWNVNPNQ